MMKMMMIHLEKGGIYTSIHLQEGQQESKSQALVKPWSMLS